MKFERDLEFGEMASIMAMLMPAIFTGMAWQIDPEADLIPLVMRGVSMAASISLTLLGLLFILIFLFDEEANKAFPILALLALLATSNAVFWIIYFF